MSFYAQRRRPSRVSAHGLFNICSVWHHLCADASVRQRLCAQGSYQGMQFRTAFGTDSSLAVGMTLLVTIDGAVSCHHRRSRRRSEGSGIPHRVSALVSPSGADPLLRSLRQGAGAQDDSKGLCFRSFASLRMTENRCFRMTVCLVLHHSDFQPWARRGSSTPSGVTRTAPTSGRARWPMMSNVWKSWRKRSCFPIGTV